LQPDSSNVSAARPRYINACHGRVHVSKQEIGLIAVNQLQSLLNRSAGIARGRIFGQRILATDALVISKNGMDAGWFPNG
jgi:hypothetical protein